MCGIIGYIGTQTASEILIGGLERLEYRGYDSAGIATVFEGNMFCTKAKGKLYNLREKIERESNFSKVGIGILVGLHMENQKNIMPILILIIKSK